MNPCLTTMVALAALLIAGCGSGQDNTKPVAKPTRVPAEPASAVSIRPVSSPATGGEHRVSRIIDQDPDGDGIANRRIVITESYDAEGLLVERIRELDREADGIIDARKVTRYGQ